MWGTPGPVKTESRRQMGGWTTPLNFKLLLWKAGGTFHGPCACHPAAYPSTTLSRAQGHLRPAQTVTHRTVLVSCNMLVTIMWHSHWTWQTLLSSPWSFPGHNPHIDWSTGTMWDWSNHSDAVCLWSAFVQFSRVPMNYINWKKVFNSTWATLPPHHPYACAIDPLSGLAVPVFPHRPWILWRWKTRPSAPSSTNGAPNDIPVRTSAPSHFFCLWTLTRCNHFLWTWPQKYFSFCFH